MPPLKRQFSLKALQRDLASRLHPLPCPAMPTLKKWSASGLIPWLDLPTAADAIEAAVKEGRMQVRGAKPSTKEAGHQKCGVLDKIETEDSPATPPRLDPGMVAQIQATCESLASSARLISQVAEGMLLSADKTRSPTKGDEVMQAIQHLESTRRHIMCQWDAYRQAVGQEGLGVSAAKSAGQGPDFLEWQRFLGRLSRMEQMMGQILEKVDTS